MSDETLFQGLAAVVQYRSKLDGIKWHTMAAFDSRDVAERYAAKCGEGDMPWDYRVLEIAPEISEAQP